MPCGSLVGAHPQPVRTVVEFPGGGGGVRGSLFHMVFPLMYYMYFSTSLTRCFGFHHGFSAMQMIKASRLLDREREKDGFPRGP